jgi:OTU domain-containing protein 3
MSVIYNMNCIVHQVENPIMVFANHPLGSVPTIHISYHLGEHYNSVRLIDDPCSGPPLTIGHELKLKEPVVTMEEEKKEATKKNSPDEIPSVN